MDDHLDDIRRPLSLRIEVYAGAGRKRWPDNLRVQIVADSFQPGAILTDIARSHGCRPQQVHAWRRMARLGRLVTGLGGYSIVCAVGVGIFAAAGSGAVRIAGGNRYHC